MGYGEEIYRGVYIVGGPGISHAEDAASYIVVSGEELVMIDTGAGSRTEQILKNMEELGLRGERIKGIILTHCHLDHIGGASYLKERFGVPVAMHELDAPPVEAGDPIKTAASWYGRKVSPLHIDRKFTGREDHLTVGEDVIHILHTPGHTPGSIVCYLDRDGKRICFGQDIHGPFLPAFGSDLNAWRDSMHRLLDLKIDILCEGHFGIFSSREKAEGYIKKYLSLNR